LTDKLEPTNQSNNIALSPMKKTFFTVTAVIEAGAGLALIIWPSVAVMLLLGSLLDIPAGLNLGRVAGAALLAQCPLCAKRH
jgi:hypothetical protein